MLIGKIRIKRKVLDRFVKIEDDLKNTVELLERVAQQDINFINSQVYCGYATKN